MFSGLDRDASTPRLGALLLMVLMVMGTGTCPRRVVGNAAEEGLEASVQQRLRVAMNEASRLGQQNRNVTFCSNSVDLHFATPLIAGSGDTRLLNDRTAF